jgi:putative membrane protein insertion efficiency factor
MPLRLHHSRGASRPAAKARGSATFSRLATQALVAPVIAYRRWLSPLLPARCRFYPSCSAYTLEALRTHGPFRGLALGIWRIARCQPFHPGGYDPVPPAPSCDHSNDLLSGAA